MNFLKKFFSGEGQKEPAFYYEWFREPIDLKLPIRKKQFVVLDTETTGLEKEDNIVSIGAVLLENGQIDPSNVLDQTLPSISTTNHEEAIAIHEIIGADYGDTKEQIREFLEYIKNRIIVGHHIQFDIQKVNQWISEKYPGFSLKNKFIDTAHLAKRIHREELERQVGGSHFLGLDSLCKLYDIPIENRHTSLGDAFITALLFLKLVDKLEKRGVKTVQELMK